MKDQRGSDHEVGTSVELFAGGGGLAIALHEAGFRHLLLNEFAARACETLRAYKAVPRKGESHIPRQRREKWPLVEGPVQDLDFSYLEKQKVTLLAGGPPCQPFSLGGEHKGDVDERNMFPEFFKAVRQIKPKAFMCENVRGLLRTSFRPYFEYILNELSMPFVERGGASWEEHNRKLEKEKLTSPSNVEEERQRYVVFSTEVNAADYGVPQIRHRVIIVGFRMDLGIDEEVWEKFKPQKTHSESALHQALKDPRSEYWKRHSKVPRAVRQQVIDGVLAASATESDLSLKPWRTLRDAIKGDPGRRPAEKPLPQNGLIDYVQHPKSPASDHIGWPGARIYPGHTPNVLDRPAKTVKAGVHGVPGGESVVMLDNGEHRYMTVRETARVMTFPDKWKPSGPRGEQMRQLGNAVPVLLGQRFAEAVAKALDSVPNPEVQDSDSLENSGGA